MMEVDVDTEPELQYPTVEFSAIISFMLLLVAYVIFSIGLGLLHLVLLVLDELV